MQQEDRGIADLSALRVRAATIGVWLTYVVCGAAGLYVALTWDRPHRLVIGALCGSGVAGGIAVSELRRHAGTQFDPACVEALLAHFLGSSNTGVGAGSTLA